MEELGNLVNLTKDKNLVDFESAAKSIISQRIYDKLQSMKVEVAKNFFNKPEET